MKNVIILGASGTIARHVIDILVQKKEIHLTLFLRNKNRLRNKELSGCRIIEGDVLNMELLHEAFEGLDIVYVNLAGDLESMAINIVQAMNDQRINRVIFISSIGIYDVPLKPVLKPYRNATDVFEASGLEYTILRPTWFTNVNEVDYEVTRKGESEKARSFRKKAWQLSFQILLSIPKGMSVKIWELINQIPDKVRCVAMLGISSDLLLFLQSLTEIEYF